MRGTTFRPPVLHASRLSRNVLLDLALACGVGIAVTLLENIGTTSWGSSSDVLRNIVIAACAVVAWRLADLGLTTTRSGLPEHVRLGVFGIAIWVGYLIGVAITGPLFGFNRYYPVELGEYYPWLFATLVLIGLLGMVMLYRVRAANAALERIVRERFDARESGIARSVEQRLNPPAELQDGDLSAVARVRPAHGSRTDFYDMRKLGNGRLAIMLADVTGGGVSASAVRTSCDAILPFLAARGPEGVVNALNSKLCSELPPGGAVSMLYAEYDPAARHIRIVNSGMPEPILVHRDRRAEEVGVSGDALPLGLRRDCRYTATTVELQPGERMLLFSDGLVEATIGTQPLGSPALVEYARRTRTVDRLLEAVETLPGIDFNGDVTLVQVARLPMAA
jgi:hypothetical protein